MVKTTVHWIKDRHFLGIDSNNHSVVLSGQKEGVGVSPSETLLIALASCSSVDVVEILEKKRKKLTLLEVTASGERDPDPPWAYQKIHVHYRLGGQGLTDKAVSQAIQLSQEKYCSVAATVSGVAEITYDYEIVQEE